MNTRTDGRDSEPQRASRGARAWSWGAVAATALLASALVACGGGVEERAAGTTDAPSAVNPFPSGSDAAAPAEANKQLVAPSMAESRAGAPAAAPPRTGGPAAVAAADGGAAEPRMPSLDFLGRSIIRTGSMDLQVESVPEAFERVSAIATGAGEFVAESRFFGRASDPTVAPRTDGRAPTAETAVPLAPRGGASLTLRVPAERFEDVVTQLRGVAAEVRTISTGSQDVTGEVTDLESTIRNLRAVEARYMEMLNSARTLPEILQVQDRLNQTRDQIERALGRLASLRRMADMSTLTVTLTPAVAKVEAPKPEGALAPVREAWADSLETLRALGVAMLVAAAFGWWMLPLLAVAVWAASRLVRASGGRGGAQL